MTGYRHREFDTRAGTIDVAVPKLRSGTYFPEWLLERRKRAEAALTSVVATCYLLGVSTRRMDKLVQSLGVSGLSRSQVSVMARDLDEQVTAFRTRPLDAGPYRFVAADALQLKVREDHRVVSVACLVATGVNADGHREVLGIEVSTSEDGTGWLAFFRDLTARGLSGVRLVTSDAHRGLVAAVGGTRPRPAPAPGRPARRARRHVLPPHMSATDAAIPANSHQQQRRPPTERFMGQPPRRGVPRPTRPLTTTAPVPISDDTALQHSPVRFQELPGHHQTEPVQPGKRGHIRVGEGSVSHVEVFQEDGVENLHPAKTSTLNPAPTRQPLHP